MWRVTLCRSLTLVLIILFTLSFVIALWRAPDFFNQAELKALTPSDRERVVFNLRQLVVAIGGATFVGAGLFYTARNYRLSHLGQVSDRFTKALERLGSDQGYVRLGAVHALSHVMRDSPTHHAEVMEVLASFIRESRPYREPIPYYSQEPFASDDDEEVGAPPNDVQAALTALAHRPKRSRLEKTTINLHGVDLQGADLESANLRKADLSFTNLRYTNLANARLDHANLMGANLEKANLHKAIIKGTSAWAANFNGAILSEADGAQAQLSGALFNSAYLSYAKLTDATLGQSGLGGWMGEGLTSRILRDQKLMSEFMEELFTRGIDFAGANFTNSIAHGANFHGAHMTECCFVDADLADTDMRKGMMCRSDLRGADMTNAKLEGAELNEAIVSSEDTYIPKGWKVDEGTNLLRKESSEHRQGLKILHYGRATLHHAIRAGRRRDR
jgi:uncharacterized protein YjbI with pentapeptide repeats